VQLDNNKLYRYMVPRDEGRLQATTDELTSPLRATEVLRKEDPDCTISTPLVEAMSRYHWQASGWPLRLLTADVRALRKVCCSRSTTLNDRDLQQIHN
jgi:hypothetical protein